MKTAGTPSPITGAARALAERVHGLFAKTGDTWKLIATERTSIAQVYQTYLLPLAALAAVLALLGWGLVELIGADGLGMTVPMAVSSVLVLLVMVLVGIWMLAQVTDALAPHFQARKSELRAFKLMAYSATPLVLVALFTLMPGAAWLGLLGLGYALWLLWQGLPRLMRCPLDKRVPYFAVLAVAVALLAAVTVTLMSFMLQHGRPAPRLVGASGTVVAGAAPSASPAGVSSGAVPVAAASVASGVMSEEAVMGVSPAASDDASAPMASAPSDAPTADGQGAAPATPSAPLSSAALERLSGQIKALSPAELAGLKREQLNTQSLNVAGATGLAVYGDYGQGDKTMSVNWVYVGANPKQTPMGEWANATLQRDDASRSERIYAEGGRHMSESARKDGSGASMKVLLANGVLLDIDAHNLTLDALKAGLPALKLNELEQLQPTP